LSSPDDKERAPPVCRIKNLAASTGAPIHETLAFSQIPVSLHYLADTSDCGTLRMADVVPFVAAFLAILGALAWLIDDPNRSLLTPQISI
jgi:hypothetical protein